MQQILNEVRKSEIVNSSRNGANYQGDRTKGANRFQRRVHSKVSRSVKEFNEIDMNKLFRDNILDIAVPVNGETDNYIVKISFVGLLDYIQEELKTFNVDKIDLRIVQRALYKALNTSNDVMVGCTCADFGYRFAYYANKGSYLDSVNMDYSSQMLNDIPQITNPQNDQGKGCKHILLVLNNLSWLIKVASVIVNYVNYMEKHYSRLYSDVIYPALYGKEYADDVQLDLDLDNTGDTLQSDSETIDSSNQYARTKNQFKQGHQGGVQFAKNDNSVKQLDFDSLISDTTKKTN